MMMTIILLFPDQALFTCGQECPRCFSLMVEKGLTGAVMACRLRASSRSFFLMHRASVFTRKQGTTEGCQSISAVGLSIMRVLVGLSLHCEGKAAGSTTEEEGNWKIYHLSGSECNRLC